MKASVIEFPNYFRPAKRHDESCAIIILPVVRIERECNKVTELRQRSRRLRSRFNASSPEVSET